VIAGRKYIKDKSWIHIFQYSMLLIWRGERITWMIQHNGDAKRNKSIEIL